MVWKMQICSIQNMETFHDWAVNTIQKKLPNKTNYMYLPDNCRTSLTLLNVTRLGPVI